MATHEDTTNTPMPDDALLTAYALGELDDDAHAEQRAAIEAQLANDPALQAEVEQIASMGEQLEAGYAGAGGPGLSDESRQALAAVGEDGAQPGRATSMTGERGRPTAPLTRLLPYAAVAACAAGATAVGFLAVHRPDTTTPEVVVANPPDTQTGQPDTTTDSADTAPSPPPAPTPRELIAAAMQTPVTVDYDNTELDQVLDDLRQATGVNFMVNWPDLDLVGIDRETPVTLQLTDVPARDALAYVLQHTGAQNFDDEKPGYRLGDHAVEVASMANLKTRTEMRTYDIRSLISAQATLLAQFEAQLLRSVAPDQFATRDGGSGGLFGDKPSDQAHFESAPRFDLNDALPNTRNSRAADRLNNRPRTNTSSLFPSPSDRRRNNPVFRDAPSFDLNESLSNSGGSVRGSAGGGLFGVDSEDAPVIPDHNQQIENLRNYIRQTVGSSLIPDDLPTRQEQIDTVVELIQDTVGDPDEWLDEESTLREAGGQLIVKTTAENHDAIAALLAELDTHEPPDISALLLAADPERVQDLAELIAEDVERELIKVREREALRNEYAQLNDNPFHSADLTPLSTFSVDVDTASYTIVRRALLEARQLPDPDAVRIEEFINYFKYDYDAPLVPVDMLDDGLLTTAALDRLEARDEAFAPFATHVEVADCPWADGHQLVRIGIKGMEVAFEERPAAHLTFLLDISGSMSSADKLPIVKDAMVLLLDQLRDDDTVSIVVYAGGTGSVIEGVPASDYERIREAIDNLQPQGGTNGEAGIHLAYQLAQRYYVPGGINRVVLCTDGDFNVGTSDTDALVELIQQKANPATAPGQEGEAPAVYLSVFGVGTGNLNDDMMEMLTNAGNGNYAYLDSVDEAARALSDQVNGTLVTIAKDVKIQVEFNPTQVAAYRLIGYENRLLNDEDFNDDTVDAGDIGAGHTVTALYEIVPVPGSQGNAPALIDAAEADDNAAGDIDPLRYQQPRILTDAARLPELLTLKLRYKPVDAAAEQGTSRRVVLHVPAQSVPFREASETTRFAAAVASFGMMLRQSPHRGSADLAWVVATADAARQHDPHGYREQFITLAEHARDILEPGDE